MIGKEISDFKSGSTAPNRNSQTLSIAQHGLRPDVLKIVKFGIVRDNNTVRTEVDV